MYCTAIKIILATSTDKGTSGTGQYFIVVLKTNKQVTYFNEDWQPIFILS